MHVLAMMAAMAPPPAMHLIAIAALIVIAVRVAALLRLSAAGDEGRQSFTVIAFHAGGLIRWLMLRLVVLMMLLRLMLLARLMLLVMRTLLLVRLLFSASEGRLRFACRVGLGVARRIRRLIAEVRLALHRLAGSLVGIVESFVAVVGLSLAAFRTVIGILLTELLLGRRDQAEIMLGVLVIILGGHRVARGHRIASQLHVLLGDVGCRSPDLHLRTV